MRLPYRVNEFRRTAPGIVFAVRNPVLPFLIQSPQTARFRYDAKQGVSAGISGHSIPGFWSLRAFAHLNGDFWPFVSASRNSVPGGRGRA
jgi:hypothetical protein